MQYLTEKIGRERYKLREADNREREINTKRKTIRQSEKERQ